MKLECSAKSLSLFLSLESREDMSVTIDTNTLQLIAMFEQMSGAQIRDCIPLENQIVFIVEQGEIAKAIGKGGKHARDLEFKSKKKVKIVEFHPESALIVRTRHLLFFDPFLGAF